MVPVESESNIEVLRQYTVWLEAEVKRLQAELGQIKGLTDKDKQEWLDAKLRDQLAVLRKKFFGTGREALTPSIDRPVGHETEQLKLHGERPQSGQEAKAKGFEPKGPVIFTYKMSDRELTRESLARGITVAGARAWEEVPGLYQQASEMTVFERVYQEALHRQCKYRLKPEYNDTGKEVLIVAPGPAKIRRGSRYSIDFAISVVTDKYEYHVPLERQRRKMEAQGLEIDTKTLYGLCAAVAEHCDLVREGIRFDILKDFCAAHLDESPWPILGKESKASYMWALSNRCGAYFQFEPTRSGAVASELLEDFAGAVLTDGFSGYTRIKDVPGIRVGHCWSHARREFFERIADFPEAKDAVGIIDELFAVEARAKSFDELGSLRKTESREITQRLRAWMTETSGKFLPSSGINRAIAYCMKFWKELTRFLDDLSLPLSNNDAERALRHIVMGRKNFGGSKTIDGADTAASIYTVIESCKRVGVQPAQYLKFLIEAVWFKDAIKTPLEYSLEKLGPNTKVAFPKKDDWQIQ